MKCKIVIDPNCEEEVLIFAHQHTPLTQMIEELVLENSLELFGYQDKNILRLRPSEIFCFTVENNKVYAMTETQKYTIKQRLYILEKFLDKNFVKINQSCIANIQKIQKFEASFGGSLTVVFKNGHRDYVSRRQVKTVKERIGI